MIWRDGELKNPFSGEPLRRDSPHSFSDGAVRFPVIENIPFLRAERDEMREETLRRLDAGDERGALALLLCDQDDWARTAAPSENDLQPTLANQDLTLRETMRLLKYEAVGDYFAYRWSDPTFLSGLCLLETHLPPNAKKVFELCCGIGHYLREFAARGIEAIGADVVFSKLWLARRFVAPRAKLICFDANHDFPFADASFDATFCHDAFYFLPRKTHVAEELRRTTRDAILIGHAHNADAENFSSGAAVSTGEYAALFENENASLKLYDDEELTRAAVENRRPSPRTVDELTGAAAIDLVFRAKEKGRDENRLQSFLMPVANRKLRTNPLLLGDDDEEILREPRYPSERYENEYAPLSDYLKLSEKDVEFLRSAPRATDNEKNGDEKFSDLLRRRILLDLPEKW